MATTEPEIQYWDSCLFINILTGGDKAKADLIKDLVKDAEQGKIVIVVSALTMAEIRPYDKYDPSDAKYVEDLLQSNRPFIRPWQITHAIGVAAARIGADNQPLTVPDCTHVAAALASKSGVLFTYDGDKDKNRRRSGDLLRYDRKIGNPSLRIEAPSIDMGSLLGRRKA